MTTYSDAVAAVREARIQRDAARDALYERQLARLKTDRAHARHTRGDAAEDPAIVEQLAALRTEAAANAARLADVERRLAALAELSAEREAIERRMDAAAVKSAALARDVSTLGNALARAETSAQRERIGGRVQEAQSARAALESTMRADRDHLAATHSVDAETRAVRAERSALRERAAALDEQSTALVERGDAADPASDARRKAAEVAAQREKVGERDAKLREAIDALHGDLTPQALLAAWDDSLPIVLLPLRLETRWKASTLCVRVYPDDVAVTTHEPVLTLAEVERGRAYWTAFHAAASLGSGHVEAERAAWHELADRFGANRASWVALTMRPTNWPAAPPEFPEQPLTKPDPWTVAPHTRVLPDRYVLLAWRGDTLALTRVGALIDDVVVLGPAPLDEAGGGAAITRDGTDGSLVLGEAFRWVRDFDDAVARGMGFRVPLTGDDAELGFDRMLVLGLKASADAPDAQALVEGLIDGHHYSRSGFSLLRQGTPTNNTDGHESGYTRGDSSSGDAAVDGAEPPRFTPTADRAAATDGQRLGDFLGIDYAPLLHASGADHADHAEAVAMNRALYAGTLGYYADHMLNEVIDESGLGALRRHFTDVVTGRGPITAIRVGSQPYGILPSSSLRRWQPGVPRRDDRPVLTNVVAAIPTAAVTGADPFEAMLLRVLLRFDQAWTTLLPRVTRIGAPGNGAANLLEVLGLHPASVELHQRVGYSYDYLRNLEAFAWGGSSFDDVLRTMIEGAGARSLLVQLGYDPQRDANTPKPYPLLLQLIWRHYQTQLDPKELIDGRPLSESAFIKPYDAAGTRTYLDWLLANASDASALEAQSFGAGIARPSSLLYMMLHFSLVMEAGRGIHRWLGAHEVSADELVRSRKFLNVGVDPSPSLWEVFRAPANRVVAGDASDRPLLEVIHAPQQAGDAGQPVQEQRAALDALRAMPTARLERALVEHVDTLSYRLDAWQTSLFTRRLHQLRRLDRPVTERRTGVYLGAYGYLEGVRPGGSRRRKLDESALPAELRRQNAGDLYEEASNGGYVHAPSLNHATAAALLRSGYLTHATPTDPDALAVNLSSGRVQRAKYLLDGIRNGQSLETLLGVAFERGLHDWTTRPVQPVVLDDLKPLFRAAFPILRTRVPQESDASGGAGEVAEDHQVVNGLTLARTAAPFPYGIPELSTLDTAQQDAIRAEKAAIADTLDTLRDVLTAESAYQLALGNFDRAAAVLQSAGNGTIPPDVQVLDTPRGTEISFTQRLAVQLTTAAVADPWPIPLGERARLEPALNAWLGSLLGDPTAIHCLVQAIDADGHLLLNAGAPVSEPVSLAELGIQPVDFIYMARSQVEESGAAELESRIRYLFARRNAVPDDVVVRIAFADTGGAAGRSFAEALPLADRLRRLLGTARPLDARHFQSASKDAPAALDNPGRLDLAEVRARVTARLAAVRGRFVPLRAAATAARAAVTAATVDALRDALVAVANTGFSYATPHSAVGATAAQRDVLLAQADALLARFDVLDPATDAQLAAANAASGAEQAMTILADAVKGWMGADLLLLPRFAHHDVAAVTQADAARDDLLSYARTTLHVPLPVEEWLHGAACVRPLVHDFEMVRAMADAVRVSPLPLAAIQLPFRTGDSWLGAQYPATMEVLHDTVSMVRHLPQGFDASAAQCGLLIDEWVESVPTREEVTGLSFNFNAPNSAPPQALLLAVTPRLTGQWEWDDLVDTVLDTFRRAKLRAVEPAHVGDLRGIGMLLPAVMAEFGTSRGSISLDYAMAVEAIREPVMAMMTLQPG